MWHIELVKNKYEGGANRVSLVQARHNFLSFGACEEEMKKHVRKPKEDEIHLLTLLLEFVEQPILFPMNFETG